MLFEGPLRMSHSIRYEPLSGVTGRLIALMKVIGSTTMLRIPGMPGFGARGANAWSGFFPTSFSGRIGVFFGLVFGAVTDGPGPIPELMALRVHARVLCSSVASTNAKFHPFGTRPEAFAKSTALSLLFASPIFVKSFVTKLDK
jgi:hypothetical protein